MVKLAYRLAQAILTIYLVASLTFFLVRLMPGNPVIYMYETLIKSGINPVAARNRVKLMIGMLPHAPLWQQYVQWFHQIIRGDLGVSIQETGTPVITMIMHGLPWTLAIISVSLIISFILGISLGVISAWLRERWVSPTLDNLASIAHAVPNYVTGLALLYLFTVIWRVFPATGAYSILVTPGWNWPFIQSVVAHAILPLVTYVLSTFGAWLLTMKSSTIGMLREDFMAASRMRGLTQGQLMTYLGWNAILPLFTGFMLSLGAMFGGSVFIESTFAYPGVGLLLGTAVSTRDYPVMQGVFLVITVTIILANVIADYSYALLDPRIKV
jgi:peptide/nickel transport system permease protein